MKTLFNIFYTHFFHHIRELTSEKKINKVEKKETHEPKNSYMRFESHCNREPHLCACHGILTTESSGSLSFLKQILKSEAERVDPSPSMLDVHILCSLIHTLLHMTTLSSMCEVSGMKGHHLLLTVHLEMRQLSHLHNQKAITYFERFQKIN